MKIKKKTRVMVTVVLFALTAIGAISLWAILNRMHDALVKADPMSDTGLSLGYAATRLVGTTSIVIISAFALASLVWTQRASKRS